MSDLSRCVAPVYGVLPHSVLGVPCSSLCGNILQTKRRYNGLFW